MTYLTLPAARYRLGYTLRPVARSAVTSFEPALRPSVTEPRPVGMDPDMEALIGWAMLAAALVLGIAIGWLT